MKISPVNITPSSPFQFLFNIFMTFFRCLCVWPLTLLSSGNIVKTDAFSLSLPCAYRYIQ